MPRRQARSLYVRASLQSFIYELMLTCSPALEIAVSLWPLLFAAAPPSLFSDDAAFSPEDTEQQSNYLGAFFDFLRTEKAGRSVSKDVWTLFLEFAQTIDPKFESYDIDAAWPSVIDEFVDWAKAKLAKGEAIKGSDAMEE
jgi:DCN1-like protein 1/2